MPPKRAKAATTAPAPAIRSTRSTRAVAAPAPTEPEKKQKAKSKSKTKPKDAPADADADVDVDVEVPSSARSTRQQGRSAEQTQIRTRDAAREEEDRLVDEALLDVERMGVTEEAQHEDEASDQEVKAQDLERVQKQIPRTRQTRLGGGARPPRTVKKVVPSEANRKAMEGLKKRMDEDARRLRGSPEPQPQNEELASEQKGRTPSPAPATLRRATAAPGTAVRVPQSALKVQSTPGVENSVLALANFRRRARQPSLLQMVQGKGNADSDAEADDETTDFTLGTDLDNSVEGLEGFKPYDESTPLQVSKAAALQPARRQPELTTAEGDATPRIEAQNEDDDDLYGATPLPSPSRKRKSDALETEPDDTEIQVRRSQPSSRRSSPDLPYDPADDFLAIPGTNPDPASPSLDLEDADPQDEPISDTLADPLSSSPPPYPSFQPQQEPRSTTTPHTLRKPAPRASKQDKDKPTQKQKPLTTATLRALLPKRRVRRILREDRAEFDIPSSSSMEERSSSSSHEEARRTGRSAATTARKGVQKKTAAAARTKSKVGALSPISSRKRIVPPAPAHAAGAGSKKKTYTRLSGGSDKENATAVVVGSSSPLSSAPLTISDDHDDDEQDEETADTSLSTIGKGRNGKRNVSRELQAARNKFAEVDEWEMEFESASVGIGGESSPWR